MEKFAEFLNFFQSDLVKFEASKTVLEGFIRSTEVNGCDDLVVSSECLSLGKCLHDSLDSLSSPEQCDSVANLLIDVLDRFDFGLDFERQLQLYVEARGNFANLDKLVAHLVRRVNLLAIRTLRQCPNGRHSRKSGGFVRGCLAFAFISIPSLGGDIFTRLHLYLEAAQVALVNLCLPQADAMCKSAVSLLLEVPLVVKVGKKPVSNEPRLLTYINDFLSFLLVVPDSPDLPPLYLLKGLINAVRKYPWPESSDGKISIWFAILTWLSTASRPQLPYHIDGLNSNDSLYGGNEAVMTELQTIADSLLDEVLTHLKWLGGNKGEFRRQSIVSLNLVDLLIQEADLSCEEMSHLTINLINLVTKKTGSQADLKSRLSQTRIFLKFKADRGCQQCQYILDRI